MTDTSDVDARYSALSESGYLDHPAPYDDGSGPKTYDARTSRVSVQYLAVAQIVAMENMTAAMTRLATIMEQERDARQWKETQEFLRAQDEMSDRIRAEAPGIKP